MQRVKQRTKEEERFLADLVLSMHQEQQALVALEAKILSGELAGKQADQAIKRHRATSIATWAKVKRVI